LKNNVALVAIASNEQAYLSEWIFHHLWFGFDPILVLVNRSDDATEALLEQINILDSRIWIVNVDFLDVKNQYNSEMQLNAYSYAYKILQEHLNANDYMFCFDIDEFWTPLDFQTTIHKYLLNRNYPPKCAFNWFCLNDDNNQFGPAFRQTNFGTHNKHLKSGFQFSESVNRIHAHHVSAPIPKPVLLGTGEILDRSLPKTSSPPKYFGEIFILHRINRSMIEYIASLGSIDLAEPYSIFKRNRHHGYNFSEQFKDNIDEFSINLDLLNEYYKEYEKFLLNHNLKKFIFNGRRHVLNKSLEVINKYNSLSLSEKNKWAKTFKGVDFKKALKIISNGILRQTL